MIEDKVDAAEALMRLTGEAKRVQEGLSAGRRIRWPESIKQSASKITDAGIAILQIAFATGISIVSLMQWRMARTVLATKGKSSTYPVLTGALAASDGV